MQSLLHEPWIAALGWTLLHFLWQGAVIALVFASANFCLRRANARLRYAAACLAMLGMLLSVLFTFVRLNSHSAADSLFSARRFVSVVQPAIVLSLAPAGVPNSGSAIFQLDDWLNTHLVWLVSIWSLGVAILSLRIAGGWVSAQTLKRRRTLPATPEWQNVMARLAARLEIRRRVRLCESTLAEVPAVIGWLRPVILLPVTALTGLTPEMMETLLAHELAHIRRHDYLVNLAQTTVETLLFYHPAVWWIGSRIRQERENCCDDLAVAACGNVLTYARALTELAELRNDGTQFAMAADGGSLLARVRRLIGAGPSTTRVSSVSLAAVALLLCCGAIWAEYSISYDRNYLFAASAAASAEPAPSPTPQAAEPAPAQTPSPRPAPARPKSSTVESPDFIDGLAAAGYQNLSVDELVSFKIHGVTPEFVRDVEALGLGHPKPDEMVSMRIHNVTPEFIKDLKTAGFTGLTIDQLVTFKIHGVDPARLAQMQKLWGKLDADQVVAAQIHGLTPEFAAEMKNLGLGNPSFDQLITMKIHGVTPEFAKAIKSAGIKAVDLDQLVAFKIHGVDPARIAEVQKLGFGSLDADEIVSLQIHNVTPEFLRGFKDLGFSKLTLDEALAASIHGVTPDFVKKARQRGFNNLTMEQIIKLKQFGILSEGQ